MVNYLYKVNVEFKNYFKIIKKKKTRREGENKIIRAIED
jgi:hypothetical protein